MIAAMRLFLRSRSNLNALALLLIVLLNAGCAATSKNKGKPSALAALRTRLDAILADSALYRSQAGVKIVSLRTGEVLYERSSHLLFHPASNQKLLTSAAAFVLLGEDFQFKTLLACDSAALGNGVINGDLALIGRGDPDLSTGDLSQLARALAQQGIRAVTGNLICDDFYLDDVRWGSGWMWDDDPSSDHSRFSALTINDNTVQVSVVPNTTLGQPGQIMINAPSPFVEFINSSITVARRSQIDSLGLPHLSIDRRWRENENLYVISGAIGMDEAPRHETMNVLDPALLAGHIMRDVLLLNGVTVAGGVYRGFGPSRMRVLAEHNAPLLPVLTNLNKISDNLTAELVLKTIGAERFGRPGTAEKGAHAMRLFLQSAGMDTLALKAADGSGVSRYNLLTPGGLLDLLVSMWQREALRPAFVSTLPIAGVDGTLRHRMKGTSAEGVLRAKTGTLAGVRALSGYTITAEGEELAFAMMMQHYLVRDSAVRSVQDRIGAEITSFRRKPLPVATAASHRAN
jgi:PBP4 family serine-type D-alanyl-D-alanine carboxypeptidase